MTLSTELASDLADATVFDRADTADGSPHEQVIFCEDPTTGLQAIIAIHSTALGPALGGTRFYPYANQGAALTDVLRLSRGMTYKAAIAGVPLGGGKAVIIGDPRVIKTPDLLRSYGRFIETLGGRYVSAGDIGTGTDDLDIIGEQTAHVVGRSAIAGGSGNSGPMTALGVYQSLRAAATATWGTPDLTGRVIGVEGVGKVGSELIALLLRDGAEVLATDVNADALDAVAARFSSVVICDDVLDRELDVYAPCALGGTLTVASVHQMTASIVCGAANNQLLTADVDQHLYNKGVVWVPDYVANAGGLIQVAGEKDGADAQWARDRVEQIYDTVLSILDRSRSESIPPGEAADRTAEARLKFVQSNV
ncbi:valine dehydrogenase [Rhodococcus ruber]|uniref:Valine dehydrogenase n=1 Tax=Rhodococcus ruber TaxID=1830 RepID=A0ABT4MHP9_9NOCA|nr:Glu/Leu/Phe/Val dehydrogenase dimerization domain-containing protein [Rhodococcus ruber]MCZ4520517.1 valine dehydrogenase [Rhodococcus ruber]